MKLLSATLRHYRVHRDVTVEFDPSRTLLGGPNEAGKSTFIEGIHRALFLKARGTGAVHKAMSSSLHGGHPEVEVRFEAGGREFTVRKRFSGQSGTTQLVESGGQTWQGEEAEERLTRVLGSEEVAGRATASKIDDQWAHLWVWQGMAGADPAAHLVSRQDDLLQQLQEVGGSVALQSALDGRVAAAFARAREEVFVKAGNARAGSDLDRARKELDAAQSARDHAAQRLAQLDDALAGFEHAEATLLRTEAERSQLATQRDSLHRREAAIETLRRREETQQRALAAAIEKRSILESAEETIEGLRAQLTDLTRSLAPKEAGRQRAEAELATLRERLATAEQALEAARGSVREARLRADLAAAYVGVFELRARQEAITQRLERIRSLQVDVAERTRQLHSLPALDRKRLGQLQTLEGKLAQARAALEAMAAGVEILNADAPVRIGEQAVEAGASRTLTEPTLIAVGDNVTLRIHPGGGDRLEAAREKVRSLHEQLQEALDAAGIDSLEQAAQTVASREHLLAEAEKARASLTELDPEETERTATAIAHDLTAAEAEVSRRRTRLDRFSAPESLEAAKVQRHETAEAVLRTEEAEQAARARHDALRQSLAQREKELETARAGIEQARQKQTDLGARLDQLLEIHGGDDARARALSDTRQALATAESALASTRAEVAQHQPDSLPADQERHERAREENQRQREEAQTQRAVHQTALQSDGAEDPRLALAETEARLHAAREHHAAVNRKAAALALIDDLFQREQRALADRFSRPLADKISGYLQCLFGPDARALVSFEDNAFKAIELVRAGPGGALPFDLLSGGAKEQVAAAVRLAIAELLAAEHGGSLPVVFDDAFAYSDPARVQILQGMLDRAARRGLQIIVLSCNPSDYVTLGARQVSLAHTPTTTAVSPPPA